jgi:hypothetical protein
MIRASNANPNRAEGCERILFNVDLPLHPLAAQLARLDAATVKLAKQKNGAPLLCEPPSFRRRDIARCVAWSLHSFNDGLIAAGQ